MYRGLRTELQRIALFIGFCALIGWLVGQTAWAIIVGGALYSLFLLRQMQRFYLWLARYDDEPLPSSSGIWGDIFDAMYRMRKRQAEQQADLQQQLTRMQDSTAALKDGVVLLDHRGQIGFWNTAAGRLLGLRRDVDEQQQLTNLLRDPQFVSYFHAGQFGEPIVLRSPVRLEDSLEIQVNEFGAGEKLLVVRDVSRLQQLEKMRSDFVANVSHELRTPITVLKGYLETLADNGTDMPLRWQKPLAHMCQQTGRMQQLVDDLSLLARLETRDSHRPTVVVDVPALAERLRADAALLSIEHTVELAGPSLCLHGVDSELYSAFSNLLTNALRYSAPGSVVQLCWGCDAGGAFVAVSDQGPGIDPVHIPRLTERFYRVDAGRSRQDGGTGLGLAIVKHALARHGACLEIVSVPGQGSTFTCRFPVAAVVPS